MEFEPTQQKFDKSKYSINQKDFWKIVKWSVLLNYKLVKWPFLAYTALAMIISLRDVAYAYLFGKAIDALITTIQGPNPNISSLIPYLALIFGYNLIMTTLYTLRNYSGMYYKSFIDPKLEEMAYTKLKKLGIQTLEQPEVNNKIFRSKSTLSDATQFTLQVIDIGTLFVKVIASLIVVINISPWIILLLSITTIPSILLDQKFRRLLWIFRMENTENMRKSGASSNALQSPPSLREIYITNAFKLLADKYMNFTLWYIKKRVAIREKRQLSFWGLGIVDQITLTIGSLIIFTNLIAKKISVGDVTFQLRALGNLQDSLFNMASYVNDLYDFSIQIKDVYELYTMEPAFEDGFITIPKLEKGPEIEIENVNFAYPNTDKYVIKNLNLKIKSGEKIAIVGHNGAGKTTLVNLICRFYRTTTGEIRINDQKINDIMIDTWYRNISVLFQDYNSYQFLTARENISIGKSDEPVDEKRIIEAAESADALKFIEQMKLKFDTTLSERYEHGTRPSTGQLQKLALARFFYRNAPLVIFDEPTASIDPVSEYNIFNKIYDFFKEKTVIIISHRFSTVRNADRIIVVDQGEIIEQGTHTELMRIDGVYAHAFKLQAEGYSVESIA